MARAFSKSQVPIWFHTVFSSSQSSVFHKVSDTLGKTSATGFKTESIVENKILGLLWFLETISLLLCTRFTLHIPF